MPIQVHSHIKDKKDGELLFRYMIASVGARSFS